MVLLQVSPGVTHAAAVIRRLNWGWTAQDGLTPMWAWQLAGLLAGTLQAAFHAEMQGASPNKEALVVAGFVFYVPFGSSKSHGEAQESVWGVTQGHG